MVVYMQHERECRVGVLELLLFKLTLHDATLARAQLAHIQETLSPAICSG